MERYFFFLCVLFSFSNRLTWTEKTICSWIILVSKSIVGICWDSMLHLLVSNDSLLRITLQAKWLTMIKQAMESRTLSSNYKKFNHCVRSFHFRIWELCGYLAIKSIYLWVFITFIIGSLYKSFDLQQKIREIKASTNVKDSKYGRVSRGWCMPYKR